MRRSTVASTNPNHIDAYFGTSYGDDFRLEHIVDAVVRFANGDVRPSARLASVEEVTKDPGDAGLYYLKDQEGELVEVPREVAVEEFNRRTVRERAYAVQVLTLATEGAAPLSRLVRSFEDYCDDVESAVDLALHAKLRFGKSGRPTLSWRVSGPGQPEQWIRFAAVMIADAARGDNTDIGRCQLPSCGRFFRIVRGSGPGKPTTKYCPGTDHMLQAHQANSTLRSQRKRRKDRRAAKAK
jgi:hypothetical protein